MYLHKYENCEAYEIDCMSPKPVVQWKRKPNAFNDVVDDKAIKTRIKKYLPKFTIYFL